MEITVYSPVKKTPGNEYQEAMEILIEFSVGKKIDDCPAVLFLVQQGQIKVRPAVILTKTDGFTEDLEFGNVKEADIDRIKNFHTKILPDTDLFTAQHAIKRFLENELKLNLPDAFLLLTEEPDGICVYIKFLASDIEYSTKLSFTSATFESINFAKTNKR